MKAEKQKLTKSSVAALKVTDKEYTVWDELIPGFGVRVWPSGVKSYTFLYRTAGGRAGKQKRITIKATTPDMAREQAKILYGKYSAGIDPAAEREARRDEAEKANAKLTVGDVLAGFIDNHAKANLRPKTYTEYKRIVNTLLVPHIGKIKIDALTPKEVGELYHTLKKEHEQRRKERERKRKKVAGMETKLRPDGTAQVAGAMRVLASAMSYAERFGIRDAGTNPVKVRIKGARRRERLFSDNEVARLHSALDELEREGKVQPPVALGIRLLFATGCRGGEICNLSWDNVDLENEILRWPESKTGYLEKPITDEAKELLESAERILGNPWVCPPSGERQLKDMKPLRVEVLESGFERTMARAGVVANENASLHLIRHWFATKIYTDKSVPLPLAMAIVGHKSVATAMRYAHITREDAKKAAQEASQRRRESVTEAGKRSKVIALREGRD